MKRLSWFNKTMYFFNIVLAVLTFLAYVLPFLAPKFFPFLSVLTLVMPLFLILNAIYFVFWMLQLKRHMFLSGLVLLMGITFINRFFKFSGTDALHEEKDFVVMSYNVRLFNLFHWIADEDVPAQILEFINDKNPDILCIQEYSESAHPDLKVYQHHYVFMQGDKIKTGQAIFSKFPILNQGKLDLPDSNNSVIFADIKKGKDVLRVYNMHLQSIKISPDVNEISENPEEVDQSRSNKIYRRISAAFRKQQQQAEIIRAHKLTSEYPIIICGDMNNSAFSYVYRVIRGDLQDAFEEAGKGFGRTYNFRYYPARIDYIFADAAMKVKACTSYSGFVHSDHYPVVARLAVEN